MISLRNFALRRGERLLLSNVDLTLHAGYRVGVVGRNGTGKSSLFAAIQGELEADKGDLDLPGKVRIASVAQETPSLPDPALEFVLGGDEVLAAAVREEADANAREDWEAVAAAHQRLAELNGYDAEARAGRLLHGLGFPAETHRRPVSSFSGGWRVRLNLARALMMPSDLLLLDEPTNHLDLDAMLWLEELLLDFRGAAVIVTHDRAFLDRVATRIVELDRGRLLSYPGSFAQYQALKAEQLAQEATIHARADKLLAQEEAWIRQGVEARRTRAQGRINRLQALRAARAARREQVGRVRLDVDAGVAGYQGKLVAELEHVQLAFGAKTIVDDLSATVLRGDKLGLIGPNGAGKTTLLKLILGELEPDRGRVRRGANLQVAYFDQMRAALDPEATLADFISPGSEWIEIGTRRQHVKSYLGDFLFSPARAASPVKSLSGGEMGRLLLARLFARPANVLVLDEPTNDLDIDTLELLEQLLQDYEGTVFLVSHDRAFLDNVVTSTLAWDGPGQWREYEGGVQDWLTQSARWQALRAPAPAVPEVTRQTAPQPASSERQALQKRKLSYKEQRELDGLPARIETLEAEQADIRARLADGSLYQSDLQQAVALQARDTAIDQALTEALERWEELGQR